MAWLHKFSDFQQRKFKNGRWPCIIRTWTVLVVWRLYETVLVVWRSNKTGCAQSWSGLHVRLYLGSRTVSHGLVRSLIWLYTDMAPVPVFKKFWKSYTAFTDTLEWPECNSDKATVGSVVCTVYTDGQTYKPCVLCETGLKHKCHHSLNQFLNLLLVQISDIRVSTLL